AADLPVGERVEIDGADLAIVEIDRLVAGGVHGTQQIANAVAGRLQMRPPQRVGRLGGGELHGVAGRDLDLIELYLTAAAVVALKDDRPTRAVVRRDVVVHRHVEAVAVGELNEPATGFRVANF